MLAYLIQPSLPLFRIAIIGEFTWIMSDYEEFVGGYLRQMMGGESLKFEN